MKSIETKDDTMNAQTLRARLIDAEQRYRAAAPNSARKYAASVAAAGLRQMLTRSVPPFRRAECPNCGVEAMNDQTGDSRDWCECWSESSI